MTEKTKACEKFWKEDGYGGKVWTEDPSKCHWLEEDSCHDEPVPKKVRGEKDTPRIIYSKTHLNAKICKCQCLTQCKTTTENILIGSVCTWTRGHDKWTG